MSATTFINPYNFVPVKNQVDRRGVFNRQEKFQGYSGKMVIRLTTLTRLFIPDRRQATNIQDEKKFFWREQLFDAPNKPKLDQKGRPLFHPHYPRFFENAKGEKIIPGSSLKGMLRSVAEALSDSCFGLDTETAGDHEHARKKCLAPLPGQEPKVGEGLCPCCRIFGYVHASESGRKDDDEGQRNFKGRVMVYDAVLTDGSKNKIKQEEYRLKELSSPDPEHRPFYFDDQNGGKIRGRKFYYHFDAQPEHFTTQNLPQDKRKTHRNCTIHESILDGAVFKSELHFENLSREELGLLLYAIRLNGVNNQQDENFMAHKVGMAKPLGFGSVQLVIENLTLFENAAAYCDFEPKAQAYSDEGETARKELAAFLESLAPRKELPDGIADPFQNAGEAYNVWKFPRTTSPEKVCYPNQQWFKDDRNHPGTKYPLRKNGLLPEPWQPPNDALEDDEEASPTAPAPGSENIIEVAVLERKKHDVVVMIENEKHKVFCPRQSIKKGDRIKVVKQPDETYKWRS